MRTVYNNMQHSMRVAVVVEVLIVSYETFNALNAKNLFLRLKSNTGTVKRLPSNSVRAVSYIEI